MKIKHKLLYAILLVITVVLVISTAQTAFAQEIVTNASSPISTSYSIKDDLDISKISNLLLLLWFISWLVESFLEILQKMFEIDRNSNIKQDGKSSSKIAKWTAIGGFVVGLIIALAGIRILNMFYSVEDGLRTAQAILFYSVDIILTASVIAGGSKGIHELTNAYKKTMQLIQGQATAIIDKPSSDSTPTLPKAQ